MLKIVSLHAKGFKNLDIPRLEFPPEGNILVIGRNESGKSTLFEAIYFALTGKLLVKKGGGFSHAIAFDRNLARVTLEFQKGGVPATITRVIASRAGGSTTEVSFLKNPGSPSEERYDTRTLSKKKVEDALYDFLQFDGDILKNSCFVQQKGLDGFIKTPKNKKREIIDKLLSLENLSTLKKEYEKELKDLEVVKAYFSDEADAEANEGRIETLEELIEKLAAVLGEIDKLTGVRELVASTDLDQTADKFSELEGSLEQTRVALHALREKKKLFQASSERLGEIEKAKNENTVAKKDVEALEREVATMKNGIKAIREKIDAATKSRNDIASAKRVLRDLQEHSKQLEAWKGPIEEVARLRGEKANLLKKVAEIEELQSKYLGEFIKGEGEVISRVKGSLERFLRGLESLVEKRRDATALGEKVVVLRRAKNKQNRIETIRQDLRTSERARAETEREIRALAEVGQKRHERDTEKEFLSKKKLDLEEDLRQIANQIAESKVLAWVRESAELEEKIRAKKESIQLLNRTQRLKSEQARREKEIHSRFLERVQHLQGTSQESATRVFQGSSLLSTTCLVLGLLLALLVNPLFAVLFIPGGFFLVTAFLAKRELGPFGKATAELEATIASFRDHLDRSPPHEVKFLGSDLIRTGKVDRQTIELVENQIKKFEKYFRDHPLPGGDLADDGGVASTQYYYNSPEDYSYELIDTSREELGKLALSGRDLVEFADAAARVKFLEDKLERLEERKREIDAKLAQDEALLERIRRGEGETSEAATRESPEQLKSKMSALERTQIEKRKELEWVEARLGELEGEVDDYGGEKQLETRMRELELQLREQERLQEWVSALEKTTTDSFHRILSRGGVSLGEETSIDELLIDLESREKAGRLEIERLSQLLSESHEALGLSTSMGDPLAGNLPGLREEVTAKLQYLENRSDNLREGALPRDGSLGQLSKAYPFPLVSGAVNDLEGKFRDYFDTKVRVGEINETIRANEQRIVQNLEGVDEGYRESLEKFFEDYDGTLKELEGIRATIDTLSKQIENFDEAGENEKIKVLHANVAKKTKKVEELRSKIREREEELERALEQEEAGLGLPRGELDAKKVKLEIQNLDRQIEAEIQKLNEYENEITRTRDAVNDKVAEINELSADIPAMGAVALNSVDQLDGGGVPSLDELKLELDGFLKVIEKRREQIVSGPVFKDVGEFLESQQVGGAGNELVVESGEEIQALVIQLTELKGSLNTEIQKSRQEMEEIENDRKKYRKIEQFLGRYGDEPRSTLRERAALEYSVVLKAKDIVERAGDEIRQRVLPITMEYLVHILPILTADRYKDVKINENYDVKVFDSKMGDYVEKTLFSGGTNDQIALGIRLAFAMATMGRENNRESFIFLDEPLGFFDDERKNCLIDFLTRGKIADIFVQRFVVSNFSSIQNHFDHIIELDNGTVINQTSTGSRNTLQRYAIEHEEEEEPILELVCKDHFEDEDGWSEYEFTVKNNSIDSVVKKIELTPALKELIVVQPKFIYGELQPGRESGVISVTFNTKNVEGDGIELTARMVIQIQGEEKEELDRQEKLTHSLR
ncbi:MAG: AAA family ATPase [Promethearchaeota archaeon]